MMPQHCVCSVPLTERANSDHFHSCNELRSSGRIQRHTMVVTALRSVAERAHCDVKVEPREPRDRHRNSPNIRPDLFITTSSGSLYVDVSIIHPAAQSYADAAATTKLHAARRRETEKVTKFAEFALAHRAAFAPFVMESFGAFGPAAITLISRLAGEAELHGSDRAQFKSHAFACLSVALQKGNARLAASGLAAAGHAEHASA